MGYELLTPLQVTSFEATCKKIQKCYNKRFPDAEIGIVIIDNAVNIMVDGKAYEKLAFDNLKLLKIL